MAAQFDGPNLIITLDAPTLGVLTQNVEQIYDDAKQWFLNLNNRKHQFPFRTSGGDPLTPGVNAGGYYFLRNDLGWRIISTDADQTINYNGNLVGQSAVLPLINVTPGRSVLHLGLQPVTQRVDEILTQTQNAAYNGKIAIDVLSSNSGTLFPVGTASTPVNNIADAFTIASTLGVRNYLFMGAITLDRDYERWRFEGGTSTSNDVLSMGGFSVNSSRFEGCTLQGTYTGAIEALQCELLVLLGMNGTFRRCGLAADTTMSAAGIVVMDSCFSEIAAIPPIIDVNGGLGLQIRNYSGGVEIRGMSNASFMGSIDLDPGQMVVSDGQNNTDGTLLYRGLGSKTLGPLVEAQGVGVTTLIDRMFDVTEAAIALASHIGNSDISLDDLTVSILDKNLNNLRDLSVSADGRTRRII